MPLPTYRRIFPAGDQGPLMRLDDAVARFASSLVAVLGRGLTFSEHFRGAELVATITVPGSFPWPANERPLVRLPADFSGSPRLVLVVDAKQEDSATHYGMPTCLWERVQDGGRSAISFHNIDTLTAGEWTLTIRVEP